MRVKFTAKHMKEYRGVNGLGEHLSMKAGDEAEVSDTVGKLLIQKYGQNFLIILDETPAHAPKADKRLRKTIQTKTKS